MQFSEVFLALAKCRVLQIVIKFLNTRTLLYLENIKIQFKPIKIALMDLIYGVLPNKLLKFINDQP